MDYRELIARRRVAIWRLSLWGDYRPRQTMQKRYQVFVSSTYTDLKNERQDVIRAILDLGHIPAGMELFPAADDEQFSYIAKIIDECDYYVLIIGGRYGSVDDTGLSCTEREYDYAHEKGLPVLAFRSQHSLWPRRCYSRQDSKS